MADTAGVFEQGVDYRDRYIEKYSRRTNIPSVVFCDVKFHPTMPDHIIVLSSMTLSNVTKVNTLIPESLIPSMDEEIKKTYYAKAEKQYTSEKSKPIVNVPNQKAPDDDIPSVNLEELFENFEGGSSEDENQSSNNDEGSAQEGSLDEQLVVNDSNRFDEDLNSEPNAGITSDFNNSLKRKETISEMKERHKKEMEILKEMELEEKKKQQQYEKQLEEEIKQMKTKKVKKSEFKRKKDGPPRLNKLDQEDRDIWEKAIEIYISEKYKLFEYQSYDPIMLKSNYNSSSVEDSEGEGEEKINLTRIPTDNRNELNKEDFQDFESGGELYSSMKGWKGEMYIPHPFTSNYQLSLWKIDEFGVIKVKDRYFTLKNKRASNVNFPGFSLQLSLDEQTMLMIERDQEKNRDLLVVSFDLYSFEILSEILVDTVDESIKNEKYYKGKSAESDSNYNGPYQMTVDTKVTSWNFGKLILGVVTSSINSRIVYKFRVYNASSKGILNTIVRGGHNLLKNKIISMTYFEENEDILHWATLVKNDIVMLQVDMITGAVIELARYTGFTPKYAYPSADKMTIYLIHQDKKTKLHKLYCAKYLMDEDNDEASLDSDANVRIDRGEVESIGDLGTMINLIKMVGNKIIIISTTDDFKSTMTVYENVKGIFMIKQKVLLRQGKKVKPMEFNEDFSFKDSTSLISESFDVSLTANNKVYGLRNMNDDSVEVLQLFDDTISVRDTSLKIKEVQEFRFHYPYMGIIKGGNEIFIYDFTRNIYSYTRLNWPILCVANTESVKTSITFRVLFDMGPYLIFGVLEAKGCQSLTLMYSKRFIEKSLIPQEKIITFYDPIPCKWDDIEEPNPGLIIQSINYMTSINLLKYNKIVKEPSKYKIDDVKHLNGIGFIVGKRGGKHIFHIPVPVKIDNRESYVNLYQSAESIRSIDFNFENETPYLYVSD